MTKENRIDSFTELCETLSDGDLNARLSGLIKELTAAVEANGGTGKLSFELAIQRSKEGQVIFKPKAKITKPEPAFDTTRMYVDDNGRLSREDPRQQSLPKVPMRPAKIVPMDGGKGGDNNDDPEKKGGN